jgi:23S rRNA pseudoU1915 N3-methylase RlmH
MLLRGAKKIMQEYIDKFFQYLKSNGISAKDILKKRQENIEQTKYERELESLLKNIENKHPKDLTLI